MRIALGALSLATLLGLACGGTDDTDLTAGNFGGGSSGSSGAPSSSSGDAGGTTSGGTSSGGASSGGSSSGGASSGGASSGGSSSGGLGSNGADKPNCKYQAHATGLTAHQQAGGLSFQLYAPSNYDPNVGHRVVVVLHSQDSDGTGEFQAFWRDLADAEQLVVIIPKGSRAPTPDGPAGGANWAQADMPKVQTLVREIDDCYNVDPKRHLLWGFSAGCFYGYLLGIGAAGDFSGLAMGGANASFARSNGYPPSAASWAIPVSHVHGTQDFNPISETRRDQTDFQAQGSVFTLHEHSGGHTISAEQVRQQYEDLKDSQSP